NFTYDRNITQDEAGNCGTLFLGVGVIGAIAIGRITDKTRKYSAIVIICSWCVQLILLWFVVFLYFVDKGKPSKGQVVQLYVINALMGFFCIAFFPTSLEMAVELAYPISESASVSISMEITPLV